MGERLSDAAIDQLFHSARSFNGYTDQPVTTAQLEEIWDLMKMAPTSANLQPARIVWCVSTEARETLAGLAGSNGDKIRQAPVTAILAMDMEFYEHGATLFPHQDVRPWFAGNATLIRDTALRNSTLQGAFLIMAARAVGLGTGPMSGFDSAGVDAAFLAGTSYKTNFICTLGYGDPATIFDRLPRGSFEGFTRIA